MEEEEEKKSYKTEQKEKLRRLSHAENRCLFNHNLQGIFRSNTNKNHSFEFKIHFIFSYNDINYAIKRYHTS